MYGGQCDHRKPQHPLQQNVGARDTKVRATENHLLDRIHRSAGTALASVFEVYLESLICVEALCRGGVLARKWKLVIPKQLQGHLTVLCVGRAEGHQAADEGRHTDRATTGRSRKLHNRDHALARPGGCEVADRKKGSRPA